MSNLPAIPEERSLPCEYLERPSAFFARRLERINDLETSRQRVELLELRAILAGMRVTESRAEVEVLEARLKQAARRLLN